MFCTYISAHYLSSGLVSVMYGLTPIFSGILASILLKEKNFGVQQMFATIISFAGLAVIFNSHLVIKDARALLLLLLGVGLFSISGILVKREHSQDASVDMHPFATALGAIVLSIPAYSLAWLVMEHGELHIENWEMRSVLAVVYLAVFGSLIGFFSYYYVLKYLPTTTVALITLITPVFALAMGHLFNQEELETSLISGSALVLTGLGVYFWGGKFNRFKLG